MHEDHYRVVLMQLYPILTQVFLLLKFRFLELGLLHKCISKFAYILSNTFYTIIKNGFCVPEVTEEQDDDETNVENVDGLGMAREMEKRMSKMKLKMKIKLKVFKIKKKRHLIQIHLLKKKKMELKWKMILMVH